jgi:flavin reductase (DIM6/NTAB) family NADH-FMN oxidoreductase RutF
MNGRVLWKVGEAIPKQLQYTESKLIQSTLIPRPLAWVSVDDEEVSLLNGYTAACYTPPTIFFAESALPSRTIARLKETGVCTLSVATVRDPKSALQKASAARNGDEGPFSFRFQDLNLSLAPKRGEYPRAVHESPIHIYCSLSECFNFATGDAMIVLVGETVVVDESVLSDPTESMRSRSITAKIDAALIQPLVSIGQNQFGVLAEIRSMARPQHQQDGAWSSTDFHTVVAAGTRNEQRATMEWNFRSDGHSCRLGFNPTLALIMPRPIGWISTYTLKDHVPHLAPYSFFIDVANGKTPMVAFSAYRPNDGTEKKDAHKDSEEMGCFCFNLCTEDFAVAVNLSAAEMKREESEFDLARLTTEKAMFVDAPYIRDAPVHYECVYEKTVDIGNFSIVIGRVKAVSVDCNILTVDGQIDTSQLRPIARLGYTDEYGIISKL